MRSEFDFELSRPRSRFLSWACIAIGLALIIGYPASQAWQSYARMRSAEAEFVALKAKMAVASAPEVALPRYYTQARQALELLNWPFDEGLRELEHCIPDESRLQSLRVDVQRKEIIAALEVASSVERFRLDGLMTCLNSGGKGWSVTRIDNAGPTGAAALHVDLIRRQATVR